MHMNELLKSRVSFFRQKQTKQRIIHLPVISKGARSVRDHPEYERQTNIKANNNISLIFYLRVLSAMNDMARNGRQKGCMALHPWMSSDGH